MYQQQQHPSIPPPGSGIMMLNPSAYPPQPGAGGVSAYGAPVPGQPPVQYAASPYGAPAPPSTAAPQHMVGAYGQQIPIPAAPVSEASYPYSMPPAPPQSQHGQQLPQHQHLRAAYAASAPGGYTQNPTGYATAQPRLAAGSSANLFHPYQSVSAAQLIQNGRQLDSGRYQADGDSVNSSSAASRRGRRSRNSNSDSNNIEVMIQTPVEIQTARIAQGQCPTCGIETRRKDENGATVSVTSKNVKEGRCLLCKPMQDSTIFDEEEKEYLSGDSTSVEDNVRSGSARRDRRGSFNTSSTRTRSSSRGAVSSRMSRRMRQQQQVESSAELDDIEDRLVALEINNPMHSSRSSITTREGVAAAIASGNAAYVLQQQPQSQAQQQPYAYVPPQTQPLATSDPAPFAPLPTQQQPPQPSSINNASSSTNASNTQTFQRGWNALMGDHFTSIDESEGERLITQAMQEGNELARGFCLFRGWGGLARDIIGAFHAFSSQASSDSSNANACAMTGYCYRNGFGTQKNYSEGTVWLKKAVALNHAWAMSIMAHSYQVGLDGTEPTKDDAKEALRLYTEAAKLGYAKAMYNLAELYFCGLLGIKRSKKKSTKWYKEAAAQNHLKAKTKL